MPKIVGTRERVHQPFYDSLIRVDGKGDMRQANVGVFGAVQSRSQLFTKQGADLAVSNLTTGGFFPSDQTFVTLAVRVWTYFRFNRESSRATGTTASPAGFPVINGGAATPAWVGQGVEDDRIARVHKLYHQTQNQLFWQFQAGDKPQLTTYTAYTPMAGGLDGFFGWGPNLSQVGGGGTVPVDAFLGPAAVFEVLGWAGVTNTGNTVIQGIVGVGAGSPTETGFPPGTQQELRSSTTDPSVVAAQTYLSAVAVPALNALGAAGVDTGFAELGGLTFTAGNYKHGASTLTAGSGVLTLSGPGTFIFALGSITVGPGAQIVLTGGARANNVYFTSTSSITMNTTSVMQGNLIAAASVTFANGASLVGRAFAQTGSVTFINDQLALGPFDPFNPNGSASSGRPGARTGGRNLPRANNGIPTSSALMRLARPILIPPRQGFVVIAIASPMGQAQGASVIEQLNGLVPNNDVWGNGTNGTITGTPGTGSIGGSGTEEGGFAFSNGLPTAGRDDIEKQVTYLIDGIHSRDVL